MTELYQLFLQSTGVCTDTRKLAAGNIFFALNGPNFNGNQYAQGALENGASYAVIDQPEFKHSDKFILVEDVLTTLQALATHHRNQLHIPILAITGSNGKTTTKELIKTALAGTFNVFATSGNLNNHIGVPLSLLSIHAEHEIAIIEMGANHIGEIASYCQWAQPTYGLITNIGTAHLEGFGSLEGIAKGKSELYQFVQKHQGVLFVNNDSDKLPKLAQSNLHNISYGIDNQADYKFELLQESPEIIMLFQENKITSTLFGKYNATNIAAAITIALNFEVPLEVVITQIQNYQSDNNRSQVIKQGNNTIVMDAYNANPTSMKAAINSFGTMPYKTKVVVLGDMFELGDYEKAAHQEVKDVALHHNFNQVVLVGKRFCQLADSNALYFETSDEAKQWYNAQAFENTAILLKGSRSMRLETLIAN